MVLKHCSYFFLGICLAGTPYALARRHDKPRQRFDFLPTAPSYTPVMEKARTYISSNCPMKKAANLSRRG